MANKLKEFITSKKLKLTEDHVLVLRKTKEDGKADKDFTYPNKGLVEAPDWDGQDQCGGGLHGLAWAEGAFDIDNYGALFQVILVDKKDGFVNLDGNKCKYRKGEIVLTSRESGKAIDFIKKYVTSPSRKMNYDYTNDSVANQGYRSTASQGIDSVANQGCRSVAGQGYNSVARQGHNSVANQGSSSTASQGSRSTASQGIDSVVNQGSDSVANQGHDSVANQGSDSVANQGCRSVANQGYRSVAGQGYNSVARQGIDSVVNQGSSSVADQGYNSVANQAYNSVSIQGSASTANQGDRSVSIARSQSEETHVHRVSENCVTVLYDDSGKPHIFSGYENKALYFYDCKIKKEYTSTPEEITSLESWEIFVFGANLAGEHNGGAARIAQEKFSAASGVGEGRTGQSYAFPTLSQNGAKVTKEELKESINKLIKYANGEPNRMFLVTKVGCGIAGFKEEEMRELFLERKDMPANIVLPKGWAHWD